MTIFPQRKSWLSNCCYKVVSQLRHHTYISFPSLYCTTKQRWVSFFSFFLIRTEPVYFLGYRCNGLHNVMLNGMMENSSRSSVNTVYIPRCWRKKPTQDLGLTSPLTHNLSRKQGTVLLRRMVWVTKLSTESYYVTCERMQFVIVNRMGIA